MMRSLRTLLLALLLAAWPAGAQQREARAEPEPPPAPAAPEVPAAPPSPAAADARDEEAAARVVAPSDADAADPTAQEEERRSSAEGEALSGQPVLASEVAALSDGACLRALQRARVPFERLAPTAGIAQPIRLTGPLEGVRYRSSERREVYELMDCRLAVGLVRFSRMLRTLGITEVQHYSTYRPPTEAEARRQPVQARHAGGMAIDAAWFVRQDGARFSVLEHFHGHLGRPVCGPDARVPNDDEGARLLRTIACDAGRRGYFHVILTPNYNRPHRNHFHLEVTRRANWQAVH